MFEADTQLAAVAVLETKEKLQPQGVRVANEALGRTPLSTVSEVKK